MGNHELYIRRRQEQSIEIQQMRYFEEQQQKVGHRVREAKDTIDFLHFSF